MFCKTSVQSFVYDLIDIFMFTDEIVKNIYDQYEVIKCFLYQNLTDTDSTSLFSVFICKLSCCIDKEKGRNIILKVLTKPKVIERLDLSDNFWEQFGVQNKKFKKKQVGFYEVKNIESTNILTITIDSKEYFEESKDFSINKKHKGLRKITPGMDFEACVERIATLHEYWFESKPKKLNEKDS